MAETKERDGETQYTFWRKTEDNPVKNWIQGLREIESDTKALDSVNLSMMMSYLLKDGHLGQIQVESIF